ncbi:hypothetical protein GGR58DRAFT_519946 [Xylaria digitata]|nr:hypothetical protein GGR58DRAFT_519946 [Xylaria digitata]
MPGKHGKKRDKIGRHEDFVVQQLDSLPRAYRWDSDGEERERQEHRARQLASLPHKYGWKSIGDSHRRSSSAHPESKSKHHHRSSGVRPEKRERHQHAYGWDDYYTSGQQADWEPVTNPRDVERWESQKPAVGWERTDGKLSASDQFYASWKYEEQAEARQAVQRQWEREHQDAEARRRELEERKAAEEREWDTHDPNAVVYKYYRVVEQSDDRGRSRHAKYQGEHGESSRHGNHHDDRRAREERARKGDQEERGHRHRHRHH